MNESNKKAGRPHGSVGKKKKIELEKLKQNQLAEVANSNTNSEDAVKKANAAFIANLSGNMQKLFKLYSKQETLPIDDLKDLSNTLMARYKIALQTEFILHETMIKIAKKELKELLETEKIHGRKVTKEKLEKLKTDYEIRINKNYRVSSTVTTLASELRTIIVEIERIENGKNDKTVNIFNILNSPSNSKDVKKLEDSLFPDIMDAEIMDDEDEGYNPRLKNAE